MTNKYPSLAYASDIATIGAGATYSTDGVLIPCENAKKLALMPYATGAAAGSSGTVTFYFKVRINSVWSTTWHTVTLTLDAANLVVGPPYILDVEAYGAIQCDKIVNGDGGQAINAVNVLVNKVE